MARTVYSYAPVNDRLEAKPNTRRAVIVLYVLMAVGILLPFVLLWLKR
jgi:predicted PurR-regulated permease PerM